MPVSHHMCLHSDPQEERQRSTNVTEDKAGLPSHTAPKRQRRLMSTEKSEAPAKALKRDSVLRTRDQLPVLELPENFNEPVIRARGSENHVETVSFEENIDLVTLQPWPAPAQQVAQEDVEFDLGLLPQAEAGSGTHEQESAAAERTWTNAKYAFLSEFSVNNIVFFRLPIPARAYKHFKCWPYPGGRLQPRVSLQSDRRIFTFNETKVKPAKKAQLLRCLKGSCGFCEAFCPWCRFFSHHHYLFEVDWLL